MTLVLSPSSDHNFGFAMPCGFHGDSVDFDSVAAAESEFCAGDWALPSPVSGQQQQQQQQQQQSSLHNLDMVGQAAFGFNTDQSRRNTSVDMEDSSLVTEELKNRLLGKYNGDECGKMETDDDFEAAAKRSKKQPEVEEEEEEEELFFQPPRRISMLWNSKLRWKEERKKVLKISINKLRRIEDPEVFLCRSVLINNTVRRLHREIREEKMARYPEVHRPVPVNSCSLVAANIPEAFPCRKRLASSSLSSSSSSSSSSFTSSFSSSSSSSSSSNSLLDCKEVALPSCYNNKENLQEDICGEDAEGAPHSPKRMRMDQTVAEGPAAHRHGAAAAPSGGACAVFATNERIKAKCDQSLRAPPSSECGQNREDKLLTESALVQQQQHAAKDRSRGLLVSEYEKQYSQYSCGQLSIFGELQSVVFHSLIASLES